MPSRLSGRTVILACAGLWLLMTAATRAQQPRSLHDRYTEPIKIFTSGLGTFTKPMSSTNTEAQAFFDQGFQMMYSFAKPEAVRSFREAWKRDPDCAICYWGEAWAWGSYLNAPMTAEEAPYAYAAVQKALSLKTGPTPKERALIDALAVRYVETFDAAKRVEQDRAYADAMQKVAAQYPDDLEVATLYADALFLLEPRRGTRDVNNPNVHRLHEVLEASSPATSTIPGACHLYVHATESTVVPGRAEACAEFLGNRFPARAISTTCRRTRGTRSDAGATRCAPTSTRGIRIRRRRSARASQSIPSTTCTCCSMRRRMTVRAQSPCGPARTTPSCTGESFYEVLTLIRFGRFDEVLQVTTGPKPDIQGGAVGLRAGLCPSRTGAGRFRRRLSRHA